MKNLQTKPKQDRLLKLLPLKDRRRQEQIRRQILDEQLFKNI
jgi:hypothetical protein